jgi:hypothetical protein
VVVELKAAHILCEIPTPAKVIFFCAKSASQNNLKAARPLQVEGANAMSDQTNLVNDELRAILSEEGSDLTRDQIVALRDFIEQVGSVEEAALALEVLDELGEAA